MDGASKASKLRLFLSVMRFFVPLALTNVLCDVGEQALYRGIANSKSSINDYAGFGIAFVLTKVFSGALSDFKQASLVMMNNRKGRSRVLILMSGLASFFGCFVLLTGLTGLGRVVLNGMHHASEPVAKIARKALLYLVFFPWLDGLAWVHAGILLKFKHSVIVSVASIADIVVQIVVVAVLLQTDYAVKSAIVLPTCAVYCGTCSRLLIVTVFYYKKIHSSVTWSETDGVAHIVPTYKAIALFWLPLASVQFVQRISRPLVNLFVLRDRAEGYTAEEATKAVAIMSVCYPVVHVPYGWLNELRAVEPIFLKKTDDTRPKIRQRALFPFYACCLCISAVWMVVMFWIPGVSDSLLKTINRVDAAFYVASRLPLKVFSFCCIPVFFRAIASGHFIRIKKTKFLYMSPVARLSVILAASFIFPVNGIHGAVMGMASLLCGYAAETVALYLSVAYVWWRRKSQKNMQEEHSLDADATKANADALLEREEQEETM